MWEHKPAQIKGVLHLVFHQPDRTYLWSPCSESCPQAQTLTPSVKTERCTAFSMTLGLCVFHLVILMRLWRSGKEGVDS